MYVIYWFIFFDLLIDLIDLLIYFLLYLSNCHLSMFDMDIGSRYLDKYNYKLNVHVFIYMYIFTSF